MIINILLGAILGTILGVFLILNSKINSIECDIKYIINVLESINNYSERIYKNIEYLLDRFNKRILVNEEYFNIIKDLLNNRFKNVDDVNDSIYNRLNTIDIDTQNLIIAEHRCTRNEIKKEAKISSKIKSQSKLNKTINKTEKSK